MAKIILTVGHGKADNGGYDSGAVSKDKKYHEFKIAREIAKYAQAYYNANYSEHCDLMNYDGNLSLQERINKLKDDTYDFIAEIHLNAGGGTGTECYYHHSSERGKKYAEAITKNIASTFDITNRGAKIKLGSSGADYFGIIRSTKPCAVLVETVFIDTDKDLAKVKTASGQKKCGEAIAKAIASVRGLKAKTSTTTKSTASTSTKKETSTFKSYKVKINCNNLNVRAGAGTKYKVKTTVHKNEVYTIVAEKNGWGLLKSKIGYIKLSFTKKV